VGIIERRIERMGMEVRQVVPGKLDQGRGHCGGAAEAMGSSGKLTMETPPAISAANSRNELPARARPVYPEQGPLLGGALRDPG
jgi:hypothetical protein